MNDTRRKKLSAIKEQIEALAVEIETVMDEEQEAFDNMPISIQLSERGAKSEDAVDSLSGAIESLEEAVTYIEDSID